MSNPEEKYETLCTNLKVPSDLKIIKALVEICASGEFNIPGISVTSQTCEILSKVFSQCRDILKLNLSDCLLHPHGLESILSTIHLTNIHSVQLRGNNIGGPSVTKLSKMISRCTNIKSLGLEWNNLGLCSEGMAQFCTALASNHSLELLDLRNNQLDEECAGLLASALKKNSSLRALDVRWNAMEQGGGQHFLRALQTNKTLTTLKLQGNSISNDLLTAIDQSIQHNMKMMRLESGFEARKELLANHVRAVNDRRAQELRDWADKSQRQVNEMEGKLKEFQSSILIKQQQIEELERHVEGSRKDVEETQLRVQELEDQLKIQEQCHVAVIRDYQLQLDILNKALAANKNNVSVLEKSLSEQVKLTELAVNKFAGAEDKINQLEKDIQWRKEELQKTITQHNGAIEEERKQAQQRLALVEEEWRGRLEQSASERSRGEHVYRERVKALEIALQATEESLAELSKQMTSERAQWNQERINIWAEAQEKENCKIMLLQEKVDHLKEEKSNLENQLSITNTTNTKLQQDNSTVISDLADLRRKLSSVQEELSYERVMNEKLKAERTEEQRVAEGLRTELSNSQRAAAAASESQESLQRDIRRLKNKVEDKERQINNIRKEEKDRAGILVAAIKNYVDNLKTNE